ncbi:MAG: MFS transporter, partial [Stackebrandtia sp.]
MTASASARAVEDAAPTAVAKRPIVAACIGNGIEWLDYSVYGYLAPTLGVLFFPSDDPTTSL